MSSQWREWWPGLAQGPSLPCPRGGGEYGSGNDAWLSSLGRESLAGLELLRLQVRKRSLSIRGELQAGPRQRASETQAALRALPLPSAPSHRLLAARPRGQRRRHVHEGVAAGGRIWLSIKGSLEGQHVEADSARNHVTTRFLSGFLGVWSCVSGVSLGPSCIQVNP